MVKSGLVMMKEYFGAGSRPVTMDELKQLTMEERTELIEGVAKTIGATKTVTAAGVQYDCP